jgi:hypothetical protein
MRLHTALYLAPLSLAAALLLVPAERAAGCAVAPRPGDSVQMAGESAIILWDAASQTEHFIRRATFTANARDFGFLVPTPTKPELAEASDEAFASLAELTRPRVITRTRPSAGAGGGCGCAGLAPQSAGVQEMAPANVAVLDAKRVAGYDAVVLEADDADALAKWLKEHGYESSPALAEWAAPYVKAKWKISAFKVARDDGEGQPGAGGTARGTAKDGATGRGTPTGQVSTSAVRMTFHTERPFFPYREPPSQVKGGSPGQGHRLLRVYFLAEGRVRARIGEQPGVAVKSAQPGPEVVWANKLEGPDRTNTLRQLNLPSQTPPASWWLTEFEDYSTERPGGEDLYFSHDESQAPVERPPIIQYVSADLPGCVMCYALALYLFVPPLIRRCRRVGRPERVPELFLGVAGSLVPKLCLGTQVGKLCFPAEDRRDRLVQDAKRSFAGVHSQAELGNEGERTAQSPHDLPEHFVKKTVSSSAARW